MQLPPPQAPTQTVAVLSFLGIAIELGGLAMLVVLFLMLRRFVLRRAYFAAWTAAWASLAIAILALVARKVLVPELAGRTFADSDPTSRALYLLYQTAKVLGFVFFVRGTLMYVAGSTGTVVATKRLWLVGLGFAILSTLAAQHGLVEMTIWQSAVAVPALGYCGSALLWLPRSRRTPGSMWTGVAFGLLAALWLAYAGAFALAIHDASGPLAPYGRVLVSFNGYCDLVIDVLLGYAMVLVLMEDAKREVDDAQAELRLTHDQLRRAALYDALTDSLNRRAYAEGVGLEMIRATFGTVVLADLDNLKLVNDRYGHAVGDELIRRCADALRVSLRPYDKLYRWGGDEFLLIVPSAHVSDVLHRLRQVIARADAIEARAVDADSDEPTVELVTLEVSLGAADYASSEDLSGAIERADHAMYQEKSRRKRDPRTGEPFSERDVIPSPTSIPAMR